LALQSFGYTAKPGIPIGAGLGPLHAKVTNPEQSVWVAQLCATLVSQERTTAMPLPLIQASAEDIAALEQSARHLFAADGDGIEVEPLGQGLWRVLTTAPQEQLPQTDTMSPMALMELDLGDWWPTGQAWRAWRRRVNEIQMTWHDHPVNLAREQGGLPAINSVWLYGGGNGFMPTPAGDDHQWVESLSAATISGDWAGWLDAWDEVQAVLLQAAPEQQIVLTGDDRIVELNNAPSRWWRNLFARGQQDTWRRWWLNQN